MTKTTRCKVVGFYQNSAVVELEDGRRAYLPSYVISDVNIPVTKKVYVGQSLMVKVDEDADGKLWLDHKGLMEKREDFIESHLGDMVKGRVVMSTDSGCIVELNGNVYTFVKGMCNLYEGVKVWASISLYGHIDIDAVLYDEEYCYYPTYEYLALEKEEREEDDMEIAA